MTTGQRSAMNGTDDREERHIADLYANDQQCRDARPSPRVGEAIRRPGIPVTRIVATVMESYASRPALGSRASEPVTDPETGRTTLRLLPAFETISYRELWERSGAVAAEWYHDAHHPLRAGEFVCALGFTSVDYAVIDLACVRLGAVAVPLQSSGSAAQMAPIIAETGPKVLACSAELLEIAVECALHAPSLRRLVVFDHHPEVDDERERVAAARERLAAAGSPVVLDTLAAVIGRGAALPAVPLFEGDEDHLSLLLYTSGSTGTPKGAMYTERLMRMLWHGAWRIRPDHLPALVVNYTPMSHFVGRTTLIGTLAVGGTAYFPAKSDMSTLFQDIALVRPTELLLVPRICEALYQRYQGELDKHAAGAGAGERAAIGARIRTELRDRFLGGRLAWAGSASAPLSPEIAAFVEDCLDLPLHDFYGSTEAGVVLVNGRILRRLVRGYQLADLPELGYFRTDLPHPRGELLIRTDALVPGYFKRPDATAEVLDADGYYRTGDIMAETGPDELRYIDRCKNVLKLSQGEFVVVSRLDALFVTSPLVRQVYVYGSSERSHLLAVVVPDPEAAERAAGSTDRLKALLGESLRDIAREAGLNSYEIPRDFLIETEPFSVENGLLSDARKLLRPRARERYGERLERMYADLAAREAGELAELRRLGRERPVLETVLRAARALLGQDGGTPSPQARFTDLGGDSMAALTFSRLLKEVFGVEVPVAVLTSPAADLRRVAAHIEALTAASGPGRPTFTAVHGADAAEARAADLTLDRFVDAATLAGAAALPRPAGPPATVLLTGANGYLGRFLCLEWLERLSRTGGTLVCLVRGSDAGAARDRLTAAFDSGDAELLQRFQDLAADHLEVLAGDVGEPGLGLDEPTWQRLAGEVDLIVHAAALVNHVLPYDQVFGPNVAGTAELIRMAITTRIKPFSFLSSVAALAAHGASAAEDADIRAVLPVRDLDHGYAAGYGTSKWAGEVLLREAHDLCGLPVAVFRSDMILAHPRYAGQVNVPDMFTRLVFSLIATGIAPRSFYRADPGGRPRAHYTGLPVDFTAEAVTTLGEQAVEGYQTFNVLNPHDDGVSLDVLVDWLDEAGHPTRRIDGYQEWLTRFETVIRALPERRRQYSVLPLLHAFTRPGEPVRGSEIPADRFRAAVQAAKVGPERDIPHLSPSLIHKYASDLKALDLD